MKKRPLKVETLAVKIMSSRAQMALQRRARRRKRARTGMVQQEMPAMERASFRLGQLRP